MKEGEYLYLTIKQQLKHLSKDDYVNLRELCHIAKNLTNETIYNVRQYYLNEKEYLCYEKNYHLLKNSDNYKLLNSNMAQQIMKQVDASFKSFFALLKKCKTGNYNYKNVKLPTYLSKDAYSTLIIAFVRLNNNKLILPYSQLYKKSHKPIEIRIPPLLLDKKIKEIKIIPKYNARFFEIQYTYEVIGSQRELNTNKALAIDLGVNNLCTCVTNEGKSFIIDGKKLKSINQGFCKSLSKIQSIYDKQKLKSGKIKQNLLIKHRNRVNDYVNKSARYIVNYCLSNNIGNLVVGYNETFQKNVNLGRKTNQTFCNLPFGELRNKLEYMCKLEGIKFVKQEESYTSKASFFDNDIIPTYNFDNPQEYRFSGMRVKRGLYVTKNNYKFNADINGALNILRKSNVVSLEALCSSGVVDTPIRIRIT